MMVVLQFSCNFDVVVEGDEHSLYLCCHLDWKPPKLLTGIPTFSSPLSPQPKCQPSLVAQSEHTPNFSLPLVLSFSVLIPIC